MFNSRGEISTVVVIGMIVVIGIATLVTSTLNRDRQITSTQAASPGPCRDNPETPPAGYSWKADCQKVCHTNSECPQNTSDPSNVNPVTSNWCYGFEGPKGTWDDWRCLQLVRGEAVVATQPTTIPTIAPTSPQASSNQQTGAQQQEQQQQSQPVPTSASSSGNNQPSQPSPTPTRSQGNTQPPTPTPSSQGNTQAPQQTPPPQTPQGTTPTPQSFFSKVAQVLRPQRATEINTSSPPPPPPLPTSTRDVVREGSRESGESRVLTPLFRTGQESRIRKKETVTIQKNVNAELCLYAPNKNLSGCDKILVKSQEELQNLID